MMSWKFWKAEPQQETDSSGFEAKTNEMPTSTATNDVNFNFSLEIWECESFRCSIHVISSLQGIRQMIPFRDIQQQPEHQGMFVP